MGGSLSRCCSGRLACSATVLRRADAGQGGVATRTLQVYWNHYDGTAWSGWVALPGATVDIPAVAASGGGVLDLLVRGADDGMVAE